MAEKRGRENILKTRTGDFGLLFSVEMLNVVPSNDSFVQTWFDEDNVTETWYHTTSRADGGNVVSTVFRWSNVILGLAGCLLNVLVFLLLLDKKLLRHTFIIFTINQSSLDFVCCLLSLISNSLHLAFGDDPWWYMQSWSFAVCYVFTSDNILLAVLGASNANLVLIAFERYMKIVHSTFHRKYFSR